MTNLNEVMERIEGIKGIIAEQEARIEEYVKEMQKHIKKGEFNKVRIVNRRIEKAFTLIDEYKGWLEDAEFEAKKEQLKANEPGFEVVIEALEEILADDIEWHKNLVKMYNEDYKSLKDATKVVKKFATMSEKEALEMFKYDLECRFIKLVGQVKEKVGEIKEVKLQRNGNFGFDGVIEGSKGNVRLNTIIAGGFNVQRAHYRTLIKKAA